MTIQDIGNCKIENLPSSDLVVLVGKNNSGKSRLLKRWVDLIGSKADYITPNRFNIDEVAVPDPEAQLEREQQQRRSQHWGRNLPSEYPQPNTFLELTTLDEEDRKILIKWHNTYFDELKIEHKNLKNPFSNPVIQIGGQNAKTAGSGSRSVLSILCKLFDSSVECLIIDEPEIGLEPRVQKTLFQLIKNISKGGDGLKKKRIIIATHSNLFLDKDEIKNNWIVEKQPNESIDLKQINTSASLIDLSFNLLGASPADLFFPENILIVEGRSDQIFLSKLLDLKYPKSKISVHFAEGINKMDYAIPAIDQMLKSLGYLSFYKEKICVLVDKLEEPVLLNDWRTFLNDKNNDRVIELDKNGIEYFYPKNIVAELSGLPVDSLDSEVGTYLENEKSSKERRADLGSLKQITKVELAEKVTEKMNGNSLPLIDSRIIGLIDNCYTSRIF